MFEYAAAFDRNIGWVTESEQQRLRHCRVAIAGLGGVGGSHLMTLARLGVGAFNIADLDVFELANFNRQAGAMVSHVDQAKLDVMAGMAKEVNPELDLKTFEHGVNTDNLDAFLDGVDLYVDSLDFFVLDVREAVFNACAERGIPAITAAPLGMGVAFLAFIPGKMSFEDYFGMAGQSALEKSVRFLMGLSPAMLQMSYLVDPSRVDFNAKKGPSTGMACDLCAGMAGTQALKILLDRGDVLAAPRGLHFDAYRNRLVKTWRPGGYRNPLTRIGMMVVRRRLEQMGVNA